MKDLGNNKKLVYILNYVHQSDVQHFVHVMALLKYLEVHHGWDIALLSEKGGSGVQVVNGVKVRYLSNNGKVSRLMSMTWSLWRLRREGYKLIFVRISKPAAIVSSLCGKLFGMKTMYWLSGAVYDFDRMKPVVRRVAGDLSMYAVKSLIDRFVTGPESMVEYYVKNYRVSKEKMVLLYNDINLDRFHCSRAGKKRGGVVKVLFVHRLSPVRRAPYYMPYIISGLNEVVRSGVNVELNIVGDGAERQAVSNIIKEACEGLSVIMHGSIPNAELPRYYLDSDVFIMPSYREGMPRALMEAMAMGLPAVSTDAGGTLDIVGPLQRKFVVARDDPEAFSRCLVDLAMKEQERTKVGEENLEHIKRYSTPVVADMYDRVLSSLV